MSHKHRKAVLDCDQFTGNTRTLLFCLADAASNEDSVARGKKLGMRFLPFGWCRRTIEWMMRAINTKRPMTVHSCLKELRDAGAIKSEHGYNQQVTKTFVDINWLNEHSGKRETGVAESDRLDSRKAIDCIAESDRQYVGSTVLGTELNTFPASRDQISSPQKPKTEKQPVTRPECKHGCGAKLLRGQDHYPVCPVLNAAKLKAIAKDEEERRDAEEFNARRRALKGKL